jgi:type IV secretory pathway TraG/TraD family ATPase VirD4
LITPDEVMRLGGNEALVFTSGRLAIRARKFRYYNEPMFKRLAEIPPPASSDRIEHAAEIRSIRRSESLEGADQTRHELAELRTTASTTSSRKQTSGNASSDPRQLAFLQSALKNTDEAVTSLPEPQERLL